MSKNPLLLLWAIVKGLLVEEGYSFLFVPEFYKGLVVAIGTYVLTNAIAVQDWTDWRSVVAALVTGAAVVTLNFIKSRRHGTAALR